MEIPTFIPGVPPKISTDDHTAVVDFRHFLSSDHDTLNRICNTLPPVQALSALEATLTERQLQGYNFIYTEGGQLDNVTYSCWSKLKDLIKESVIDLPVLSTSNETSLLLSCSVSDVVSGLSGLMEVLDTDPIVNRETAELDETHEHPADVFPDAQLPSETSFTEALSSAEPTHSTPTGPSHTFPFRNRSFPEDDDNDILPYPKPSARKSKNKNEKKHFFLLTSKEAVECKRKEKEQKMTKEKEKQEKVRKRLEKKAEKEKHAKENKQAVRPTRPKRNAKKQISKNINGKMNSPMKANSVNKKRNQPVSNLSDGKQESCFCFVCSEEYVDPPEEEWIQCDSCAVWVHEECANIEGTVFICENCDE